MLTVLNIILSACLNLTNICIKNVPNTHKKIPPQLFTTIQRCVTIYKY